MGVKEKIDLDIFKLVTKAIAKSSNLVIMANHLTQLLVGALGIKGCSIFILNPESKEIEALAGFGLSIPYMTKGPLLVGKSMGSLLSKTPVVISDTKNTDRLQYPEEAKKEGIGAIVSIPIISNDEPIGALRLYHHEKWNVAERDLDSLMIIGENIGLAMTYSRIQTALSSVKDAIDDVHPIWLESNKE